MGSKLSRRSDARNHVIANCATSLVLFGQIETTLPRAKTVQPYVEKLLTLAKKETLSSRREVARRLRDDHAVAKIFDIMVHNMTDRSSGFTSIYTTRNRHGDGALCAILSINKELFSIQENKDITVVKSDKSTTKNKHINEH